MTSDSGHHVNDEVDRVPTPDTPEQPPAGEAPRSPLPAYQPTDTPSPYYGDLGGPLPVCDYTGESEEPCEEPAKQKRWSGAAVITSASLGAVVGGLLVSAGLVWAFGVIPGTGVLRALAPASTPAAVQQVSIAPRSQDVDVAQAVAKKTVPSVVGVTIKQQQVDPWTGAAALVEAGQGSGVIIRSDGYILTNNHVVQGASEVVVTMGVESKAAKVVGTDPSTDLAVIKIEGTGYPAIDIGSSKNLQVGQFVMAVGNPFGLEKTVTSDIISALQRSEIEQGRRGQDITAYTNLIQTDAAINPGNSGGALVDENGKLVGINSLIQSPSGSVGAAQSAGIGFAIPVDFAMDIAEQLITTGKATHPYIGLSTATVDEAAAAQYGLPVKSGAYVRFVSPGSPAEAAAVKVGDIIVRIGNAPIGSREDMFAAVRDHRIGETVPVEVARGDQTLTLNVTLSSDAGSQ